MKQTRQTNKKTQSKFNLLTILLALIFCFTSLFACNKPVEPVVITADFSNYQLEDKTLKDFMQILQDEEMLTFETSNGMITSINGTSNTTNSFWMLYTNDAELSNTAWGTIEYNGETFASAIYGFESLTLKDGCIYIWSYQTF